MFQEVTEKSERIAQLEQEKSALIKQLFEARARSAQDTSTLDSTFIWEQLHCYIPMFQPGLIISGVEQNLFFKTESNSFLPKTWFSDAPLAMTRQLIALKQHVTTPKHALPIYTRHEEKQTQSLPRSPWTILPP